MNLVEQFTIALVNHKGYGRLAALGVGKSFAFFLVFMFSVAPIYALRLASNYSRVVDSIAQITPEFTLTDGRLTTAPNVPMGYIWGRMLIVIDTTGQTTLEEYMKRHPQDGIFIGADRVAVKFWGIKCVLFWKHLGPCTVTKKDFLSMLETIRARRFWAVPVCLVLWPLVKLLHILILSIAALLLNSVIRSRCDYVKLWNISLYAIVPVSLVETIVAIVGLPVPFWRGLYWVGAIGIVANVLVQLKKTSAKPVLTDTTSR
ncbi:MAG: DUF1189 family protein [Firmicutes bacterium]|nr:DUF1189 family protein [Candidatus Fermentithermobacillaceae bacterium]